MEERFPPKPKFPEEPKPSLNRSLLSLLMFVVIFFFLFGQNLRFLFVLIGVLAIHEMGHLIMMRRLNFKEPQMFFIPFVSALVEGSKEEISEKERIQIILAGPVPGILFGLALYLAARFLNIPDLELPAQIFLFLNIFNLLPFVPLDGGRMVETLYFEQSSSVQMIFMILTAVLLALLAVLVGNWFLLIVPLFLTMSIGARRRIDRIRRVLGEQGINYQQSYDELKDEEYWLIRDELIRQTPLFRSNLETGKHEPAPIELRIMGQVRMILNKPPTPDLSSGEKTALLIVWVLLFVGPLILMSMWASNLGMEAP
jgi:stage IV sporulation protein FB